MLVVPKTSTTVWVLILLFGTPTATAALLPTLAAFLTTLVLTMECAPDGGQFAGWELTGTAGLSEDESHGQAPHP